MVTIVCVLAVLIGLALATSGLREAVQSGREWIERQRVVVQLHQTDAKVAADHAKARRAMNDAAGQSWRNPFE